MSYVWASLALKRSASLCLRHPDPSLCSCLRRVKVLLIYDVSTRPPRTSLHDKTTDRLPVADKQDMLSVREPVAGHPYDVDKHDSEVGSAAGSIYKLVFVAVSARLDFLHRAGWRY